MVQPYPTTAHDREGLGKRVSQRERSRKELSDGVGAPMQAQIDAGPSPGTSSAEHAGKRRLKRELAEMRRALRLCGVPPKQANRVHIFGGTPFITTGAHR